MEARRRLAISLENPLAAGGRSVLVNRFGDLHEPERAIAAEICLAWVSNTNTLELRNALRLAVFQQRLTSVEMQAVSQEMENDRAS